VSSGLSARKPASLSRIWRARLLPRAALRSPSFAGDSWWFGH
jgi:hypothetical protein